MEIVVCASADAAARTAAQRIGQWLQAAPDLVLGLATGRTMEGIYAELVRLHREEGLSFARCRTFNLDEYAGLAPENPGSYRHYMNRHLFGLVDIGADNTHVPDGLATDAAAEGQRYEKRIRDAGGIDVQLLGIGENGHIGFNEPGSPFSSRTRAVELTSETLQQNAGLFADQPETMPVRAITMGIATILESRQALLVATGAVKATVLAAAVEGAMGPHIPASALQQHPRCCVIADTEAASLLRPGRIG